MPHKRARAYPAVYRLCPSLLNFDWLFRVWKYFDTVPHAVAWLSCAGFVFGEGLYVLGTISGDALRKSQRQPGRCMGDTHDWLVSFAYLLGDVLWVPSVICLVLEANNKDFDAREKEWRLLGGELKQKPRYRWLGLPYRDLDWWGALCYCGGVAGYLTSSVTEIIADCKRIEANLQHFAFFLQQQPGSAAHLPIGPRLWLTAYTNIGAGVLFLFAGALYSMAFIHLYLVPGLAVACCMSATYSIPHDADNLEWWAMWTHWWGGLLFFMTGVFQYWYNPVADNLDSKVYLIEQSFGFGLGSLLFQIGGICLLAQQSRARYFVDVSTEDHTSRLCSLDASQTASSGNGF